MIYTKMPTIQSTKWIWHESAYMNTVLSHKEKSVYFMKDMDGVRAMNEIEVNLSQDKIEFMNDAYQKE